LLEPKRARFRPAIQPVAASDELFKHFETSLIKRVWRNPCKFELNVLKVLFEDRPGRGEAEASKALRQGNRPGGGSAGTIGAAGVNSAADLLEKTLSGKIELTDVSAEEAPKKFEGQISEYFKRLTRAE